MFQAFILGLVQGVGEFLPISSSAHLIVVPWLFGWEDQGLSFDVALHWATLLAVLVYFRKDLWHIGKGFWHSLFASTRDLQNNIYQKLAWMLVVASVPAGLVGKFLESTVEGRFRNPLIPAVTMTVFGCVLLLADKFGKKEVTLNEVTWKKALWVGVCQTLALLPGVSRSGSTITAGLLSGFTRETAAKFSFLLAVPVTLGAGVLKLPEISHISSTGPLVVGFVTALCSAFLAIKYLMSYVSRQNYSVFVWYRFAFSLVIIAVYFFRPA